MHGPYNSEGHDWNNLVVQDENTSKSYICKTKQSILTLIELTKLSMGDIIQNYYKLAYLSRWTSTLHTQSNNINKIKDETKLLQIPFFMHLCILWWKAHVRKWSRRKQPNNLTCNLQSIHYWEGFTAKFICRQIANDQTPWLGLFCDIKMHRCCQIAEYIQLQHSLDGPSDWLLYLLDVSVQHVVMNSFLAYLKEENKESTDTIIKQTQHSLARRELKL